MLMILMQILYCLYFLPNDSSFEISFGFWFEAAAANDDVRRREMFFRWWHGALLRLIAWSLPWKQTLFSFPFSLVTIFSFAPKSGSIFLPFWLPPHDNTVSRAPCVCARMRPDYWHIMIIEIVPQSSQYDEHQQTFLFSVCTSIQLLFSCCWFVGLLSAAACWVQKLLLLRMMLVMFSNSLDDVHVAMIYERVSTLGDRSNLFLATNYWALSASVFLRQD